MRLLRFALPLLLASAATAQSPAKSAIPNAEADLAWLNRYLDTNAASRKPTRSSSGPSIPFNELKQHIGKPLRVTLANGVARSGVLVEATGKTARLTVRVGAGDFLFSFENGQVGRIEER